MNTPTGVAIEVYCTEPMHDGAEPVVALLIQLARLTYSIGDGPVTEGDGPHHWSVSGGKEINPTPRSSNRALTGTKRVQITCMCGYNVQFGDRLGYSYATYKAINDDDQPFGGEHRVRNELRRRSNFEVVDLMAARGMLRVSLRALDRILK